MPELPNIVLEAFEDQDIERLLSWIDGPSELVQWGGPVFEYPLDRKQLSKHLERSYEDPPKSLIYRVVDRDQGAVVGHAELGAIDRMNRAARASRLLVGASAERGCGYGAAIVYGLLELAFEELRLHRVELGVYDFNETAIRCYERAGFAHEGIRREAVRVGNAYWNSCTMSILEDEWRASRSQPETGDSAEPTESREKT